MVALSPPDDIAVKEDIIQDNVVALQDLQKHKLNLLSRKRTVLEDKELTSIERNEESMINAFQPLPDSNEDTWHDIRRSMNEGFFNNINKDLPDNTFFMDMPAWDFGSISPMEAKAKEKLIEDKMIKLREEMKTSGLAKSVFLKQQKLDLKAREAVASFLTDTLEDDITAVAIARLELA